MDELNVSQMSTLSAVNVVIDGYYQIWGDYPAALIYGGSPQHVLSNLGSFRGIPVFAASPGATGAVNPTMYAPLSFKVALSGADLTAEEALTRMGYPPRCKVHPKCECGSDSVGSPKHSHYCPKASLAD